MIKPMGFLSYYAGIFTYSSLMLAFTWGVDWQWQLMQWLVAVAGAITLQYFKPIKDDAVEFLTRTFAASTSGVFIGMAGTYLLAWETPQIVLPFYYASGLISLALLQMLLTVAENDSRQIVLRVIGVFLKIPDTQGLQIHDTDYQDTAGEELDK